MLQCPLSVAELDIMSIAILIGSIYNRATSDRNNDDISLVCLPQLLNVVVSRERTAIARKSRSGAILIISRPLLVSFFLPMLALSPL